MLNQARIKELKQLAGENGIWPIYVDRKLIGFLFRVKYTDKPNQYWVSEYDENEELCWPKQICLY